jgi:hypothetical protein
MNTQRSRPVNRDASVLLASLVFIAVLSLVVASYLGLSAAQTVSVARSQAWNAAIAVAEAGVEESLAQLNAGIGIGALNLAANGWEAKAGGNYGPQQRRYLASSYYDVIIVPGTNPMICSTGYTAAPFGSAAISRAVQVTTEFARLFVNSMAAKEDIDFKGFNPSTDSFDSSLGPYGTTPPGDRSDVNTTSGFDSFDFQGSVMARSIKLNGHYNFHFDEDLANHGPVRGYVANSWKEL